MKKQCRQCGKWNVMTRGLIAVSKYCVPCRKIKLAEKKAKKKLTKGYLGKQFTKDKDKCDKLWRQAVILHYGDKCVVNNEHCKGKLNTHHVVSRANKNVRWYIPDGVPLCAGHHVFFNESAHQNPLWFRGFMLDLRGLIWEKDLMEKANKAWDKDIESIKIYLEKEVSP
jgi:hypothetical protein